jgi:hypothetical protein
MKPTAFAIAVDNQTEPPTLESVSPRYSKVVTLQRQLQARREEIEAELKSIATETNKTPPPLPMSNSPMRHVVIEPSPAAKKLMGDLSPEPRVEIINAGNPLRRRAAELSDELEAIIESLSHLDKEWRRARMEASAALADLMRQAYKRVSQRVIAAMVELADTKVEHSELLAKITKRGASLSPLRPIDGFELIGDPRDRTSPIRLAFEHAIHQGHCDAGIASRWQKGSK